MLILTRKPEQRIIINENIIISVLAVDGDRVKIGIQAPAEISVLREEVQRAVGGENRSAAAATHSRRDMEKSLLALRATRTASQPAEPLPAGTPVPAPGPSGTNL